MIILRKVLVLLAFGLIIRLAACPHFYALAQDSEEEESGEAVGSGTSSQMPVYHPGFNSAGESITAAEEAEESKDGNTVAKAGESEEGEYSSEDNAFILSDATILLDEAFDPSLEEFLSDLLEDEDRVSLTFSDTEHTDISLVSGLEENSGALIWEFDPSSHLAVFFYTEGQLFGQPDYVIQENGGWFRWADDNSLDPEHIDQIENTGLHDSQGRQYAEHFLSQKYFYDDSGECMRLEFYTSCGNVGYETGLQEAVLGRYTYRVDAIDNAQGIVDTTYYNDPYPYGWDPEITGVIIRDAFGRYFLCEGDGTKWLIISRSQGLDDGAEFLNTLLIEPLVEEQVPVTLSGYEYDTDVIYFDRIKTRILAVTEGEARMPVQEENLYQQGLAELIDIGLSQHDLVLESNGNIQEAELIVDHENPQDQAVAWQWQRINDQEISWGRDFDNLDLSAEDLSDLVLRAVVSGDTGSEFLVTFIDDQDRSLSAGVNDYLTVSGSLQYLAIPLEMISAASPDFNWASLDKIRFRSGSDQGKVLIQQLRIVSVSGLKERGLAVGVFEDNKFSPINWWQGLKPAYVLSYKDMFDIVSEDIAGQLSSLAENDQIPYLTLEFWPMEAKSDYEQEVQRELFVARYGEDIYEQVMADTDSGNMLESLASGIYDPIIIDYADAIASLDSTVLLRIFHEFNGHWYPWSVEGSSPEAFVSAWERIHDIFSDRGADDALFVYSPFVLNDKGYDPVESILSRIRDQVDIIALDGYGPSPDNPEGLSFNELFTELTLRLEKFNLPFIIGEFSSEIDKENFYTSLDDLLRAGAFPQLIGMTYFDIVKFERGLWRDFSVDTIYQTVRMYQADEFYRMTAGEFSSLTAAFAAKPRYYWGRSLPEMSLSASVADPQRQVTVQAGQDFLEVKVVSARETVYLLDLDQGDLSLEGKLLSATADREEYLKAIKDMEDEASALLTAGLSAQGEEDLALVLRYLAAIIYRLENPDVSMIVMPVLPGELATDPNGNVTIEFVSGTLDPAQLSQFWAEVTYGTAVEYWDITPGALSIDGTSLSLHFSEAFDGLAVGMKFFGFDLLGRQTRFTDPVWITVESSASAVTMPVLPETVQTDFSGKADIVFVSGTLFPGQLSDLWAEVSYEGKTEYWDLDPGMLSFDGTVFSLRLESAFDGKTIALRLYGFDLFGKQTALSNTVLISVSSIASIVEMPVLPSSAVTDPEGRVVIVFQSGRLFPNQISDLWAEVSYDGKTEYWDLHPSMLSSDGTYFVITFDPFFKYKTVTLSLYAFDIFNQQTQVTNPASIYVQ